MSEMGIFRQSGANLLHVNREMCVRWDSARDRLRFKAVLPNCHAVTRDRTMAKTPKDKGSFARDETLAFRRRDTVIDRLIHLKNDLNIVYGRTVRSVNSSRDVKYVVVDTASSVDRTREYAAE